MRLTAASSLGRRRTRFGSDNKCLILIIVHTMGGEVEMDVTGLYMMTVHEHDR
jgi:hypothetical protein